MEQITANDVLDIIADRAQWCRENGESDMRNILNTIRSIKEMIAGGKTCDDIIAAFAGDEDDED